MDRKWVDRVEKGEIERRMLLPIVEHQELMKAHDFFNSWRGHKVKRENVLNDWLRPPALRQLANLPDLVTARVQHVDVHVLHQDGRRALGNTETPSMS